MVEVLEANARALDVLFATYAGGQTLGAEGLRAFLAEWWIAPALLPKRQALQLNDELVAVLMLLDYETGLPCLGMSVAIRCEPSSKHD